MQEWKFGRTMLRSRGGPLKLPVCTPEHAIPDQKSTWKAALVLFAGRWWRWLASLSESRERATADNIRCIFDQQVCSKVRSVRLSFTLRVYVSIPHHLCPTSCRTALMSCTAYLPGSRFSCGCAGSSEQKVGPFQPVVSLENQATFMPHVSVLLL